MNLINLILIVVVIVVCVYMVRNFIQKRKAEESDEKLQYCYYKNACGKVLELAFYKNANINERKFNNGYKLMKWDNDKKNCPTSIDYKDEKYYEDFCSKLGIANKYSYKQEFIRNFLFDENDPNSVMHNLLAAYDNAVIMRNELSSETMSYVQMAVDALEKDKYSNAPILKLQQVFDYIFAFWGSADDYVESETSRNILKFGRSVERLDLYTRFSYPPELVKKEFSILLNRLYKVGIECNVDATDRLISIILEKDSFEEDKNIILNELSRLFTTTVVY